MGEASIRALTERDAVECRELRLRGLRLFPHAFASSFEVEGLRQIHIAVVTANKRAERLYRSFGFSTYGVEPGALRVDGAYFDLRHMTLLLDRRSEK